MPARKQTSRADRNERWDRLLDKSTRQHDAWVKQFEKEKELLAEFPIVKAEVASIKTWCEEHDAAHRQDMAERKVRQDQLDEKLGKIMTFQEQILDIKRSWQIMLSFGKWVGIAAGAVYSVLRLVHLVKEK